MAALCSPAKELLTSRVVSEASSCRSLKFPTIIKRAASVMPATRPTQSVHSGVLQCQTAPPLPRTFEGDYNLRMLFNRGLDTVKDLDKDSIWSALEEVGAKPVVLDMYSNWCGSCRLIYPKLVKLSGKYSDVVLDCSTHNKLGAGFSIAEGSSVMKGELVLSQFLECKHFVVQTCNKDSLELEQLCQVYEMLEILLQYPLEDLPDSKASYFSKDVEGVGALLILAEKGGSRYCTNLITNERNILGRPFNEQKSSSNVKFEQG